MSLAAGAGVGVVMYLLNTVAVLSSVLRPLQYVSLFYYSGGAAPLGRGVDAGGVAVLLFTSAALPAVALVLFERRDVRI